jgi:hypothetical protein
VNWDVVFYPTVGLRASKKLGDVRDVMVEFRAALTKYLVKDEELCEPDDVRDIVLDSVKGKALILDAKAHADKVAAGKLKSNVQVSGGIDKAGNLVIAAVDAEPNNFSKSAIVRKEFVQKVIKLFRKQKNVVANIQPDDDELIKRNAERQAAKYRTTVQKGDAVDVGGIKFGTIVLAAHGGRAAVSGTIIGTDLGQKSPAQIVALLTENQDEKKRLNPKFKGTIILSGCFTAAGNQVVPKGYDYSIFAGKVKQLLDKKGYQNYLIKGMAGPSRTTDSGDKQVIPAKDDDVVEQAKAKLERKKAEAAQAAEVAKLMEMKQQLLEGQLLKVIDQFKQLAQMSVTNPTAPGLENLKQQVMTSFTDLETQQKQAMLDARVAKVVAEDKQRKIIKRGEKLIKQMEELQTKYTADGVLTFGERRL